MSLFFLVVAAFFIAVKADDAGPYGNYSGTCALRPVNGDQTKYVSDIDMNENATGSDKYWSANLLSSDYKALFHLSVRPIAEKYGYLVFNSNNGPWLNDKWGEEESHVIEFSLISQYWIEITNTPDGLYIEASDYRDGYIPIHLKPYQRITVAHRTANPATDYKYFYLHRPTQSFGHVVYGPHNAQYFWDVLERSEQSFSA